MIKDKKCVVIGVCGGIAAYKALEIVSLFKKADVEVKVIMTDNATQFIKPLSFQALSNNPVIVDMFEEPRAWEIQHISLAKAADLVLVIPASANIIGKVANGIADDMLSTTIMATKANIVFAPAMNTNMYENKIVQSNIEKLKQYGYKFVEPDSGRLACGDTGKGKLCKVNDIFSFAMNQLYDIKDMQGKKVLITAGPTSSNIDPVRCITNISSGKMGYELAEEAVRRGAEVYLVSGKTSLEKPYGVNFISVNTNNEMYNEVINIFKQCDIVIKSAAVSDYKVKEYSEKKIKKKDGNLSLELVQDTDILKSLGEIKENQLLVGFAAESNNVLEYAKEKVKKKNLDFIVANDISRADIGFSVDNNEVTVINKDGDCTELPKMSKREVAREIFNIINKRR